MVTETEICFELKLNFDIRWKLWLNDWFLLFYSEMIHATVLVYCIIRLYSVQSIVVGCFVVHRSIYLEFLIEFVKIKDIGLDRFE